MSSKLPVNPLAMELEYFHAHRGELVASYRGKFALIKGGELIGAFDTDENAYRAGVARFGNTPLLIRRITAEDEDQPARFPALTVGLIRAHP